MIVDETCNRAACSTSEFRTGLLDCMSELVQGRLQVESLNAPLEECMALGLHFLLTWASRGVFMHNGSAAQACARLHDAICAFHDNTTFERIIFLLFRFDSMLQESSNRHSDLISRSKSAPKSSSYSEDDFQFSDTDISCQAVLEDDDTSCFIPEPCLFYVPLIKALLDKYYVKLEIESLAPNLQLKSAKFITEFQKYYSKYSDEWRGSFLGTFQEKMENYTRKYIVNPSTEVSLLRALASESLIKARRERSQQTLLAIQRLSEYHPTLMFSSQSSERSLTDIQPGFTPTDLQRASTSSASLRAPSSLSDTRRGSIASRSIISAAPAPTSPEGTSLQQRRCTRSSVMDAFNVQLMEKESRVLASIRRKRWKNLRFAFVRSSSTSLWFSPFPQEIHWRLSELETAIRMRCMLEPNPWFSKYLFASEERDGLIRKMSRLEDGGELLQKLSTVSEDQKLCLFLHKGETTLDKGRSTQIRFSVNDDDNFAERPLVRSFSTTSTEVLASLTLDHEELLLQRIRKRSLVSYKDMKGDFVADEDWKLIQKEAFAGSRSRLKSCSTSDLLKLSKVIGQLESEADELSSKDYSPAGDAVESPGKSSIESDEKEKNTAEERTSGDEEEEEDEEELAPPTTLYFKEPALLKDEVMRAPCHLISLIRIVPGWLAITPNSLHFLQNHAEPVLCEIDVSGDDRFKASEQTKCFSISLSMHNIREIHLCRYNLLRSAIEIFLIDNRNYFFNFPANHRNKVYTCIMSHHMPQLIYRKGRSPSEVFKNSHLTECWVNREITNFEYLMRLNTIAGRTYNDLSQYPVLPWILANYTSTRLNLDEPSTFRDLSRPIGIVNPDNIASVREKYESFEDISGDIPKFHYGTHYSSAAGVMYYLVRTEPYTSLHIQLQGRRFDLADRQFSSIPTAWSFMMSSPTDNRELIPEFFYFPNFLRNDNNFDLGRPQLTGKKLNDVELPPWASTPEEFIRIHRGALESDHVSANLHKWIDLIFGYKQRDQAAENALNVYHYLTYEGAVNLDDVPDPIERASIEGMIKNFGQTPCQLLKTPHATRITYSEWIYKLLVKRRLPILNAALIYMKTNMESNSPDTSPKREANPEPQRKLSVRLSRQRTRSTMIHDEQLPIDLNQHTIEIYFSFHPAPKCQGYTHPPVFSTVRPYQSVQLPDLRIATPMDAVKVSIQKRASLHDAVLREQFTRSRLVSGLKSIIPSTSVAAAIGASMGSNGGSAAMTATDHLVYQVLTVDEAGWVRQHLLTPLTENEPEALSESELLQLKQSLNKIPPWTGGKWGSVSTKMKSATTKPEPISPVHIDQENLRFSPSAIRQRLLGPLIYPPRENSSKAPRSKATPQLTHLYGMSTNGCHLYAAGRWDNRIAVYSTQTCHLDTLVTTPHTDVITTLAVDPGCFRRSAQHGSAAQYVITGSRDGTVCVWNFTLFSGKMTKQMRADRLFIENFEATKKLETEKTASASYLQSTSFSSNNESSHSGVVKPNHSDGYPAFMQEEIEACIQPGMPFDDSTVNFGCGCKVTDIGTTASRKTFITSSNFMPIPPSEVAKVVRLFPADESGRLISHVALYLALDMALWASQGSNIIRIHAVKRGVWSRQVALPESATIDHLLIQSLSNSIVVQWTASSSQDLQLRLTRFNINGKCVAEAPVFQEGYIPPPSPPANTRVTRVLIGTLSPSANARSVVSHALLLATSSGHLIMRDVESLSHLRIFSIGEPIVHMTMTMRVYGGGANLILLLASGAFVVAYPGLTAPFTSLTSVTEQMATSKVAVENK